MLLAHPVVLKNLIEQYETLRALHAEDGTEEARRRMEDVAYTLRVSQRQARDPRHVGLRAEHGATFGTELLPSARVSEVLDRLRRNDVRCRSVLGLPDLG